MEETHQRFGGDAAPAVSPSDGGPALGATDDHRHGPGSSGPAMAIQGGELVSEARA
ncbi:MAG TPA: hypothetical protein VH721_07035 [Gaiellaceae bacterium]